MEGFFVVWPVKYFNLQLIRPIKLKVAHIWPNLTLLSDSQLLSSLDLDYVKPTYSGFKEFLLYPFKLNY